MCRMPLVVSAGTDSSAQSVKVMKETSRLWSFCQRYTGTHEPGTHRDEQMKLFLDCEFTQLNRDTKLISLALVSEAGHEFYVELTDTYQAADCSDFVIQNVLPQLNLPVHGQTLVEAQASLIAFLGGLEGFGRGLLRCS